MQKAQSTGLQSSVEFSGLSRWPMALLALMIQLFKSRKPRKLKQQAKFIK